MIHPIHFPSKIHIMPKVKSKIITPQQIKKIVEKHSKIDNISIKSRKGPVPYIRFIYAMLCYEYRNQIPKYSLANVGNEINRDHATIIYAIRKFEEDNLSAHYVYKQSKLSIRNVLNILPTQRMLKEDVIKHYSEKHFELSEYYRSKLRDLRDRIKKIKTNDLIYKISELDNDELKELEIKLDAFFKVSEHRRKNKCRTV